MHDPRFSQPPGASYPSARPDPSFGPQYGAPYSNAPPPVAPWQGTPVTRPSSTKTTLIAVVGVIAAVLVLVAIGVARSTTARPGPSAPTGVVRYAHSGWEDGTVQYAVGLRDADGRMLGDYLRETGWFAGAASIGTDTTADKVGVRGLARGSYGIGSKGRGYGTPHAKLEPNGGGLRAILYTTDAGFASPVARAFADDSQRELSRRFGKHVTVVLRLEQKKGTGVTYDDLSWD